MKLEQLIVQYLYANKKVSIQDIGTFTLSPDVIIPAENEKETNLPENAIQFHYNSREGKDEGLIDFIVQQSRKIHPLATSDLESYSLLSRQFLNIGKPMVIEGIGTLIKNQEGTYDFEQGHRVNPKMATTPALSIKEDVHDEISFKTAARETGSGKGMVVLVVAVLLLSAAAALYYFLVYDKNNNDSVADSEQLTPVLDTVQSNIDTTVSMRPDSLTLANQAPANASSDGSIFRVVIKEYPTRVAAQNAFNRLSTFGHKLQLIAKDSPTFKIAMPFMTPLSDTTRATDSLKRFFGGKPYVEL